MRDPIRKALAWQRTLDERDRIRKLREESPLKALGTVDGVPIEISLRFVPPDGVSYSFFTVKVEVNGMVIMFDWFNRYESALRRFNKLKARYGFTEVS